MKPPKILKLKISFTLAKLILFLRVLIGVLPLRLYKIASGV